MQDIKKQKKNWPFLSWDKSHNAARFPFAPEQIFAQSAGVKRVIWGDAKTKGVLTPSQAPAPSTCRSAPSLRSCSTPPQPPAEPPARLPPPPSSVWLAAQAEQRLAGPWLGSQWWASPPFLPPSHSLCRTLPFSQLLSGRQGGRGRAAAMMVESLHLLPSERERLPPTSKELWSLVFFFWCCRAAKTGYHIPTFRNESLLSTAPEPPPPNAIQIFRFSENLL